MKQSWYYDLIAPFYDTLVPRDIEGVCDSLEEILKRYNQRKEILDLGCGTGRFTIALAKRGYKMQGLDICDEMLKIARSNAKERNIKIKFTNADIRNFELRKKANVIWARGSLGDLLKLSDFKKALQNIRNNLSNNGIFIFDVRDYLYYSELLKDGPLDSAKIFKKGSKALTFKVVQNLNKKTRNAEIRTEVTVKSPHDYVRFKVDHALRHYTKKELSKLLKEAEFEILETMSGYELAKENKPRILIVAKR